MKISHNVPDLTDKEIEALTNAKYYVFVYDVGLILLTGQNNEAISWACSNSVLAKEFLTNEGIPEK